MNSRGLIMPVHDVTPFLKVRIFTSEFLYCGQFCEPLNPGKIKYKDDQDILKALQDGSLDAFDQLYTMYRSDFFKSAAYKFHTVPMEDIVDAWQDTLISFFEQIRSGRISTLTCSVRSFLFLLGYRYIIKYKKHYFRELATDLMLEVNNEQVASIEFEWDKPLAEEKEMLQVYMNVLPEQTRKMLILRYLEEKSIEEIRTELNYTSTNAVSVSLSRGLSKLRELFNQKSENIQ